MTGTPRRLALRGATEADRQALRDESIPSEADVEVWAFDREEGGDLVAIAYCGRDQQRKLIHVLSIVVASELRGWGYGSEAVELVEEQYPGSSFEARVDQKDGLNLYFWLRLGYRPGDRESTVSAASGDGMITMIRTHYQE